MPLQRRLPKRGFRPYQRTLYCIVNLGDLAKFEKNAEIDLKVLKEKGLVKKAYNGLKILAKGDLSIPLTVRAARFSQVAKEKIEKAGGKALLIEREA